MLAIGAGRAAVTVDVLVEGRHFRRDWSSAQQVGAKAAAATLADVAAMGAAPVALVVGFGAPASLPVSWAVDCAAGIEAEAARAGAHVVGGDVTASDAVLIAVTGIGDLQGRGAVLRSGAQVGDRVAICGRLGWSAAGLELLRRGLTGPTELVDDHRQPQPPYEAGVRAAFARATAMIDISDGLVADARHIAQASNVRIDLSWSALLAHVADGAELLRDAASLLAAQPAATHHQPEVVVRDWVRDWVREWVLHGGEDHGLLACFSEAIPAGFTVIGSVGPPIQGAGVWVDEQPAQQAGGHEHYRSS